MDFNMAQKWFQQDRIRELAESFAGLRFLKLRSLSRREHLEYLFSVAAIDPTSSKVSDLFREAFALLKRISHFSIIKLCVITRK